MLHVLNENGEDLRKIFKELSEKDLAEIERAQARKKNQDLPEEPAACPLTSKWETRIGEELRLVVQDLHDLSYEESVVILMPQDLSQKAVWVRTVTPPSDGINITTQVHFEPTDAQKYEAISYMRKAQWILQVHNHPNGTMASPSDQDVAHAFWWTKLRPELRDKMKFFIVAENNAWEYLLPGSEVRSWHISAA